MSSGRRAVALRPGQLLAVGGMLFSMFFGAGNLILPPLLGLQAGDQAIPAMTGFLIAGIGFPGVGALAGGDNSPRVSACRCSASWRWPCAAAYASWPGA